MPGLRFKSSEFVGKDRVFSMVGVCVGLCLTLIFETDCVDLATDLFCHIPVWQDNEKMLPSKVTAVIKNVMESYLQELFSKICRVKVLPF